MQLTLPLADGFAVIALHRLYAVHRLPNGSRLQLKDGRELITLASFHQLYILLLPLGFQCPTGDLLVVPTRYNYTL